MTPQRILVLGGCGSGKSTFARRLSQRTGLPVVHLDQLYWSPGWVERPAEEFHRLLTQALEQPAWIMDGNYSDTLPLRLTRCDQIFLFDLSPAACVLGVLRRIAASRGKTRPDMAEDCPERLDLEFLRYTWRFARDKAPNVRSLVAESGKPCLRFTSRRQTNRYLQSLDPKE